MADILIKQGSKREALEEISMRNIFTHAQTEDDLVIYKEDEFKIRSLVTNKDKEAE